MAPSAYDLTYGKEGKTGSSNTANFFNGSENANVGTLTTTMVGRDQVNISHHYGSVEANVEIDVQVAEIVEWLKGHNFDDVYRKALDQRMPNTGRWFLELPQFQQLVHDTAVTLCATGMPGSGKTILSSTSAQHLKESFPTQPDIAVIFAFLRYDEPLATRDILASLLTQLFVNYRHVTHEVMACAYSGSQTTTLTGREVSDLLKVVVRRFTKVFILVDGLDEAADDVKDELLSVLISLAANILLTSRPLDLFLTSHAPGALRVSIQAHATDIEIFVAGRVKMSARLQSIMRNKPDLLDRLIALIKETSRGMFLVARLQMDAIRNCRNVNGLFQALENLPSGLNDMYRHTFERIKAQSDEDVHLAYCVFVWLLHAQRPLSPDELQEALAVSFERCAFDPGDVVPIDLTLSVCCGLVEVEHKAVRFIHYTAQEYMKTVMFDGFPDPHAFLAVTCLIYLHSHLAHLEKARWSTVSEWESFHLSSYAHEWGQVHIQTSRVGALHDPNPSFFLPKGHAGLLSQLAKLSLLFARRFQHTVNLSDITGAISAQQTAVNLTHEECTGDLPVRLTSLGLLFMLRYEWFGEQSDIVKAADTLQIAVDLTPSGHASLPGRLCNLGTALMRRAENICDPLGIAEAISAIRRAVELTPEGHADLPVELNNLAGAHLLRFLCVENHSDLAEAISVLRNALQLTPDGHENRPGWLFNLGYALYSRYLLGGAVEDLDQSVVHFKHAANDSLGHPHDRLRAAVYLAGLLHPQGRHSSDILASFDTALGLVSLITGLKKARQCRHISLQPLPGIAFSIKRADKGLEWMEEHRRLIWSQLGNFRSPFDSLHIHDHRLAQSLTRAAKNLDLGATRSTWGRSRISMSQIPVVEEHTEKPRASPEEEWEDILKELRASPGFETFLQPTPCSNLLQHLPEAGYVVLIHIDDIRCDAVALLAGLDKPLHIPLDFPLSRAQGYRDGLYNQLQLRGFLIREGVPEVATESISSGATPESRPGCDDPGPVLRAIRPLPFYVRRGPDDRVLRGVLRGIWNSVVKPILDALGITREDKSTGKRLPRIWWCPAGVLSFLPIHAAGIYGELESESALDYVVSSYIPSIAALNDLKNRRPIDKDRSGLFLTNQPDVPGVLSIPGTTAEVRSIYAKASEHRMRALKLEGVTAEECLRRMEEFSSIHLACHASSNAADPLQSRFRFHDSSLNLATILKTNLQNADLAFLSACQTSTVEVGLHNEAVHLAAGMLAAGYRRVVATMWSIDDHTARQVAVDFYDRLLSYGESENHEGGFDGALSAQALNDAIQSHRARLSHDSEDSLYAWIPYVHFGY